MVFQAMTGWMTLIITLYMMQLAMVDRMTSAKIREKMATDKLTYSEAAKQVVASGWGAPAMAMVLGIALAAIVAIVAGVTAQFGFSGIVSRPTAFMVHEGEQVSVGPPGSSGGGGGNTTIQYFGRDFDKMLLDGDTRNKIIKNVRGV